MERKAYPSDLTDLQWENIEHLFPKPMGKAGRPRTYTLREIVDALLYLARGGCSWRMLPHDLPPWDTVYGYFSRWREAGVWQQVQEVLYGQLGWQSDGMYSRVRASRIVSR